MARAAATPTARHPPTPCPKLWPINVIRGWGGTGGLPHQGERFLQTLLSGVTPYAGVAGAAPQERVKMDVLDQITRSL